MSAEYRLVSDEERNKPNIPWKYAINDPSFVDEFPDSENYTFASEALSHLMMFAEICIDEVESKEDARRYYLLNDAEQVIATITIDPSTDQMTTTFLHRSFVFKKSADTL